MWSWLIAVAVLASIPIIIIRVGFWISKRSEIQAIEWRERTATQNELNILRTRYRLRRRCIIAISLLIVLTGINLYFLSVVGPSSLPSVRHAELTGPQRNMCVLMAGAFMLLVLKFASLLLLMIAIFRLIASITVGLRDMIDNKHAAVEELLTYLPNKIIHAYEKYSLYSINAGSGLGIMCLRMWNDSEKCWHYERVDPRCRSVQDALDYRHYGRMKRVDESHWIPEILT